MDSRGSAGSIVLRSLALKAGSIAGPCSDARAAVERPLVSAHGHGAVIRPYRDGQMVR